LARLRGIVNRRQRKSTRPANKKKSGENGPRRSGAPSFVVSMKGALGQATWVAGRATEIMQTMARTALVEDRTNLRARARIWTGRGLSGLVVVFMTWDGVAKLVVESHVVKAMAELGWPPGQTVGLGILVLACTAIYAVPRTSVLGAILLTAFFGGATAAKVRIEDTSLFFSVVMGALAWAGLYLRDERLRALLPIARRS
jgi:hypothetical protein